MLMLDRTSSWSLALVTRAKEERRRQRKKEEDKGCRRAHLHARMEKKKRKARMTLDEACAVSCSTFQKRALFVL